MFKNNMIVCYYFGIFLCLWFFVPTLLITDAYPFLRFGMYAEIPNKQAEHESFFVEIFENKHKILFQPQMLGFNEGHFQYIVRYFVYQKKIPQFFSQIFYYLEKKQKINAKKRQLKCIIFQKIIYPKNKNILPKITKIAEKEMFF